MRITVKTLDSRNHSFDVNPETTILQLKEIISDEISMTVDRIRLIFGGNILNDEQTVSQIGLDGATLHCVDRTPPTITTLPQNATPTQPTNQPAAADPQTNRRVQSLLGSVDVGRIVNTMLQNFQSAVSEPSSVTTSVPSRLVTCNRFMDHIESLLSRYYSDGGPLNRYIFQSIRSPQSEVNLENPFIATTFLLRRISNFMEDFRRFLDAYHNYITAASSTNAQNLLDNDLYPRFPHDMANMLHSLSHVFHNLSDVMVSRTDVDTGGQYGLVVPLLSMPRTNLNTVFRSEASETVDGENFDTNTEQNRANRQNSGLQEDTNINPIFSSIPESELQDGLAYHVTLQFSADIPPFHNTPDIIIFQDTQPPPPNSNVLPSTVRAVGSGAGISTAAGSSSQNGSSQNAPTNSNPTENVTRTDVGSSDNNSNLPPRDPNLLCNSFFCGTLGLPNLQTPPVSDRRREPRQQRERRSSRPERSQFQTRAQTESTPSTDLHNIDNRRSEQNIPGASDRSQSSNLPVDDNQSLGIEDWKRLFPESFVPIIERDVSHQKNTRRSQPNSDGYIACSPMKRKRIEDQDEATNFLMSSLSDAFISSLTANDSASVDVEGLRQALFNDQELSQQYRHSIEIDLSSKLVSHDDFSPEHYPQCYDLKRRYQ